MCCSTDFVDTEADFPAELEWAEECQKEPVVFCMRNNQISQRFPT